MSRLPLEQMIASLRPSLDGVSKLGTMVVAVATALWFCMVAMLFSQQRVRAGFARMGHWFDRTMGAVLVALGVKLAFTEMH